MMCVQAFGEKACTLAIAIQHVQRHTLRRLGADAGQALQRLDQA